MPDLRYVSESSLLNVSGAFSQRSIFGGFSEKSGKAELVQEIDDRALLNQTDGSRGVFCPRLSKTEPTAHGHGGKAAQNLAAA